MIPTKMKILLPKTSHDVAFSSLLFGAIVWMFIAWPSCCNGISEDGRILLQIKERDWIDKYNVLSNWNESDDDPCTWNGVFCDYNYNFTNVVTKISLTNASIAGNLTSTICGLQHLRELVLKLNDFGGPFPDGILHCKRLQKLVLSQNQFEGSLPHRIYELSELRLLNLAFNKFSGELPAGLGMLPNIKVLVLQQNFFNGSIPAFLGNLTSLINLSMPDNPLAAGIIPPELGNLKRLKKLWLRNCSLVGKIPYSFGNLSEMDNMDLSMNQLSGRIPTSLMTLSKMRELVLFSNNLCGQIPENIHQLKSLVNLDMSMNRLNGSIPEGIANLTYLELLYLYWNRLSGSIPSNLDKLRYLDDLSLWNNKLTGLLPQNLGNNSELFSIDVGGNDLRGPLPKNLCRGAKLAGLFILSNRFTGSLPPSLGSCKSLKSVQVYENQLTGEVPLGLWGSPLLLELKLMNNNFEGAIPADYIGKSKNLARLVISNNRFSGIIPSQIGELSNLEVLIASNNRLSGPIDPQWLARLKLLNVLVLDQNMLWGEIPKDISSWPQSISHLNLGNNHLTGSIPASMGYLTSLNVLDLSNNQLHGNIPPDLGLLKLTFFNVSGNRLSGSVPAALNNLAFNDSFVGNPDLCGDRYLGLHSCISKKGKSWHFWMLSVGILVSAGLICLIGLHWLVKGTDLPSVLQSSKVTFFQRLEFREFDILKSLTDGNMIGSGGSGKVYKVTLDNGEVIAVKKIWKTNNVVEDKEFEAEVDTLGKIRHANIVKLLCSMSSADCKLLVYEYMENGSLSECLRRRWEVMEWPIRYKIAVGAAQGLCYLHHDCSPPIVHRDVKSSNILLDWDFEAHIADFGVARILHKLGQEDPLSVIAGSYGYIAPEYAYTTKVNEKSDVYSFGVVLLELVTGKIAADFNGEQSENIVGWIQGQLSIKNGAEVVLDCRIDDSYREEMMMMLRVALLCTSTRPLRRPSMREVVEMLVMCNPNEEERQPLLKIIAPHLKTKPRAIRLLHQRGELFPPTTATCE